MLNRNARNIRSLFLLLSLLSLMAVIPGSVPLFAQGTEGPLILPSLPGGTCRYLNRRISVYDGISITDYKCVNGVYVPAGGSGSSLPSATSANQIPKADGAGTGYTPGFVQYSEINGAPVPITFPTSSGAVVSSGGSNPTLTTQPLGTASSHATGDFPLSTGDVNAAGKLVAMNGIQIDYTSQQLDGAKLTYVAASNKLQWTGGTTPTPTLSATYATAAAGPTNLTTVGPNGWMQAYAGGGYTITPALKSSGYTISYFIGQINTTTYAQGSNYGIGLNGNYQSPPIWVWNSGDSTTTPPSPSTPNNWTIASTVGYGIQISIPIPAGAHTLQFSIGVAGATGKVHIAAPGLTSFDDATTMTDSSNVHQWKTYTINYRPTTAGDSITITYVLTTTNTGAPEIDFNALAVN